MFEGQNDPYLSLYHSCLCYTLLLSPPSLYHSLFTLSSCSSHLYDQVSSSSLSSSSCHAPHVSSVCGSSPSQVFLVGPCTYVPLCLAVFGGSRGLEVREPVFYPEGCQFDYLNQQ